MNSHSDSPEAENARPGQVTVITGAQGGAGKTCLTANLAAALAMEHDESVCVVDACLQFGGLAAWFDTTPAMTLAEVAAAPGEIDALSLQAAVAHHESGVDLYCASLVPQPLGAISTTDWGDLLKALMRLYRHVLVDLPGLLTASTVPILESAARIILVTGLHDIGGVHQTRAWTRTAVQGLGRERLRLVINRASRADTVDPELAEETIGLTTWARIPDDPRLVGGALNTGAPFVANASRHPVSVAIRELAGRLSEESRP